MCLRANKKTMEEHLNPLAESIIALLVFEERFESVLDEIPHESRFAVADELKSLIAKDLIRPVRALESNTNSGVLFDSDRLGDYSFTLTAKGIAHLENNMKAR
jgi:hypothetical protein